MGAGEGGQRVSVGQQGPGFGVQPEGGCEGNGHQGGMVADGATSGGLGKKDMGRDAWNQGSRF